LKGARKVVTDVKTLKKRMGKSFKNFMNALDDDQLPKLDLVASWCEDAELMVTLLNQGQEHFSSFQLKSREFLESVEKRQLQSARDAAVVLNRMRKDCHSRYRS
jgi:XXXCH domain-containing protein